MIVSSVINLLGEKIALLLFLQLLKIVRYAVMLYHGVKTIIIVNHCWILMIMMTMIMIKNVRCMMLVMIDDL